MVERHRDAEAVFFGEVHRGGDEMRVVHDVDVAEAGALWAAGRA